mgnify:FL=1
MQVINTREEVKEGEERKCLLQNLFGSIVGNLKLVTKDLRSWLKVRTQQNAYLLDTLTGDEFKSALLGQHIDSS